MRARTLALAVALGGLLLSGALPGAAGSRPDPRKAAAALVARMQPARTRARGCTFAASKVVSRNGRFWLATGSTCYPKNKVRTRVRIFRWSGDSWRLDGSVTGPLGPSQWLNAALLTGSRAPDFAVQGCGAGDNNCLSVVSNLGGRWHAVPFQYGYGTSLEVNGIPVGHLVQTEVDACGCAGGPSTWMYERYTQGVFVPTDPPGRGVGCSPSTFETIADFWQTKVLRFNRVSCAGGWALAVGDGAGFTGPAVGLFDRGSDGRRWHLLTLDNGNALPAAPAIYDLPLSLLSRLAAGTGSTLAPHVAAGRLIARLQSQYGFDWAQQNGIVEAGGKRWLIAVVPAAPAPNDYSPAPVGAVIYRWDVNRWVVDGRLPRVRHHLNVNWFGGWFVSVTQPQPSTVAFELVGSCCTTTSGNVIENAHSTGLITNVGGNWHIVPFR
jgi:hypothetical protein